MAAGREGACDFAMLQEVSTGSVPLGIRLHVMDVHPCPNFGANPIHVARSRGKHFSCERKKLLNVNVHGRRDAFRVNAMNQSKARISKFDSKYEKPRACIDEERSVKTRPQDLRPSTLHRVDFNPISKHLSKSTPLC
jgi:hypothetical protein